MDVNGNVLGLVERGVGTRQEAGRLGWMALTLTPGMGPTRIARAMQRLGRAERVFEASLTELEGVGLPAASAQFVFDGRARAAAEDEAQRVAETGGSWMTLGDEEYPERLREIFDPPAVLWIRGDVGALGERGSRWLGRDSRRRMGRAWRRSSRGISRCGRW